MTLNSVLQHNRYIVQGSYIGCMFRLIDQSSSGLFRPEDDSSTSRNSCADVHYLI